MGKKKNIIKNRKNIKDEEMKKGAGILRSGGLGAFSPETV